MSELRRILHIEDDPSIQSVTKLALEAVGGFEVLSCSSGAEALREMGRRYYSALLEAASNPLR